MPSFFHMQEVTSKMMLANKLSLKKGPKIDTFQEPANIGGRHSQFQLSALEKIVIGCDWKTTFCRVFLLDRLRRPLFRRKQRFGRQHSTFGVLVTTPRHIGPGLGPTQPFPI